MNVSLCAALSFLTSLMTSAKVWGPISYILAVMAGASQSPLTKMQIAAVSLSKANHCLEVMDIGSKSFIVFLLYLHKV